MEGLSHFFPLLSRQKHLFVVVMVEREEKMLIDKMTKQINAELKAEKKRQKGRETNLAGMIVWWRCFGTRESRLPKMIPKFKDIHSNESLALLS